MPRYKVQASDGKTLTIEAPDEHALDEAMSDYEAQSAPPPAAEPQAPSLGQRAGEAVLSTIPGRGTYEAFKGGASGPQKASAISADIAQAALLVPQGLAGGVRGLARGAGAGAAFNLANDYLQGVNKSAGEAGGKIGDTLGKVTGYPFQERETPSVLRNFLAQIPQAVGETAGELAPSAAALFLAGKAPGMLGRGAAAAEGRAAAAAPGREAAQELTKRGYPATESHAIPGDVRLKQALTNPALSAEREAYMAKMGDAQRADLEGTLKPSRLEYGPEATAALGDRFQKSAANATKERSTAYGKMMDLVNQAEQGAPEVTGVGQRTHAGELFARRTEKDLARRGVNVEAIRQKALDGKLTQYDVPPSMNAADVQATIKFADVAKKQAPRPADLAPLASNFAKSEGLFEKGGNPSALKQRANRTAVTVAQEVIKKADKASGPAYPSRLPEWKKQRANWAQGAGLAEEQGKFKPRMDAEGQPIRSEMTSPEQVFTRDVISGGAQRVKQWKDYLGSNGQDPAIVERMAMDHLDTLAGGASGKVTAQSLKQAWQKLAGGKNVELGRELFSPETQAKVQQLISRMEQAEAPLAVMGTQVRNPSATSALQRLGQMGKNFGSGAVGMGAGAVVGGPGGAALGGLAGHALQKGVESVQAGRQAAFMARPPALAGPEMAAVRRAQAQQRVAALMESLKASMGGGKSLAAQAALSASR